MARWILAERVLAAAGNFLVISTMHKFCDLHQQGFCLADELTLWCPGEAHDGFRQFRRSLVQVVGVSAFIRLVNLGVRPFLRLVNLLTPDLLYCHFASLEMKEVRRDK